MFEFLEELFGNGMEETAAGTEGTAAAGMEGAEMPNESPAGTMEQTGGGVYIKNGILYNGSIDTMLTDLSRDMAENLKEQAEQKARLEASGEPYMDSAGIIHNASWEQDYQSLMSELPGQIEAMAEVNRENIKNGNFPPLYDGFVSNPYYDPTGSWAAAMSAWDTVNSFNTVPAPDYTGPEYTREELESEIDHSLNMAGQYAEDRMTITASGFLSRAENAAEKLEDLE